MRTRVVGLERDDAVGPGERGLGRGGIAGLPLVDEVGILILFVVADEHRAVGERLLRRRDGRQHVIVDVDQFQRILGDVGIGRDDGRNLLALEADLVGGEHGLGVARHRRHPGEVVLREQFAGDDGDDAVERSSPRSCRSR